MTGLYPTPTRLRFLADVDAGAIHRDVTNWRDGTGRKVNALLYETSRAGWVTWGCGPVTLTDAGRAVLAGAR